MNALLFKISCFFYVFIYSCYLINICLSTKCDTSNQCLITDNYDESHEKEKYSYIRNSFEWSDLLTVVKKAQENYVPPKSKSCDCFLNQIKKDLKKWRSNGITFDMIETSKKFGVHYQIINHRLYREKNCKFPARCEGIEHFILQIINKLPDLELIINVNDWPQTMLHHTLPIFSFSKDDKDDESVDSNDRERSNSRLLSIIGVSEKILVPINFSLDMFKLSLRLKIE